MAENEIRIKDLPLAQQINETDDVIVLDNATDGTRKLQGKVLLDMIHSAMAKGTASGAVATFTDGADGIPMTDLDVAITPKQDLHGYDSPWVGGSGKNKISPNLSDWTKGNPYRYFKIPNFTDSIYVMSVVDNDTSVDLTGANVGFMNNYPDDSVEYNWVITDGVVQSNKTNVSGRSRVNCNTIIIYPNSEDVFNRIFQRYKIQVELGSTATSYAPYSNECPISGWSAVDVTRCEKNLVNWKWNTFNDGKMEIFLKGGTYTLSAESALTNGNAYIRGTKPSGEYVSREELGLTDWGASSTSGVYYGGGGQQTYTFNVPNGGAKIEFGKLNNNGTINAQLEVGSQATAYEPYNGNTYTINFVDGSSPLTVYGGTLDVVSGVLTVDRWYNSFSWGDASSSATFTNTERRTYSLPSTTYNVYPPSADKPQICDKVPYEAHWSNDYPHFYCNERQIVMFMPIGTSSSEQIAVSGELQTKQTYQLTPTEVKSLLGVNNIFADTGDILNAEYVRDTTTIINQILARLNALES